MAASELEVHVGTDTTIDMPISLNACNDLSELPPDPRPRHRLSDSPPPPLMTASEIAAAQASDFPSGDEAAVYTAALNAIQGSQPGKVVLVANRTLSLCVTADCPDRYNKRVRIEPEVVLGTLENFLAVREKRVSIRNDFARQSDNIDSYSARNDIVLIGDSAMSYLHKAAHFPETKTASADFLYGAGYWNTVRHAYPNASALAAFSVVAFSPRRKQALVELAFLDMSGFTPSRILVFNNVKGEWRPAASF